MATNLNIAIIGAGPAGCTLAKLLLRSQESTTLGLDLTIFESESSLDARTQGGTLDLHSKTGLAALKRAGLYDQFLQKARFDGEAFQLCNQHLKRFVKIEGPKPGSGEQGKSKTGRPEIDRLDLRRILLDALPNGLIQWGRKLKSITLDTAGRPTLHFESGEERSDFDLVIGADGAWSKVRNLLSDEKPYFSGVAGWWFKIDHAEQRAPEAWKLANRGSIFTWGKGGRSIMAQQLTQNDALSVSALSVCSEDTYKNETFDKHDARAVVEVLLKRYEDFHPDITRFLAQADDDLVMHRNLYMLPVGNRWEHKPFLTLLGDAAHLMTPFAGEGVNLAMADALKLTDSIVAACQAPGFAQSASEERAALLSKHVLAFEEDMFMRAAKVQQMTKDMMDAMFFAVGAPEASVDKYIYAAASDEVPWGFESLLRWASRIYFTVWRWWNM